MNKLRWERATKHETNLLKLFGLDFRLKPGFLTFDLFTEKKKLYSLSRAERSVGRPERRKVKYKLHKHRKKIQYLAATSAARFFRNEAWPKPLQNVESGGGRVI